MTLREAIEYRLREVKPAYMAFFDAQTANDVYAAAKAMAQAIYDIHRILKEIPPEKEESWM